SCSVSTSTAPRPTLSLILFYLSFRARRPPPLFPYTTLFRSVRGRRAPDRAEGGRGGRGDRAGRRRPERRTPAERSGRPDLPHHRAAARAPPVADRCGGGPRGTPHRAHWPLTTASRTAGSLESGFSPKGQAMSRCSAAWLLACITALACASVQAQATVEVTGVVYQEQDGRPGRGSGEPGL